MKNVFFICLFLLAAFSSCEKADDKANLLACSGNCIEITGNIFNKSTGNFVDDNREIKILVRTDEGLVNGYFSHIGTINADKNGNFLVKINRDEMKNYPIGNLHFKFILSAKENEFGPFDPLEYTLNSSSPNFNINYIIYNKSTLIVSSHNTGTDTIFHYNINLNCDSVYNQTSLLNKIKQVLPGETVLDTITTGLNVKTIVEFTYTISNSPMSNYVRLYNNINCEDISTNKIYFNIP